MKTLHYILILAVFISFLGGFFLGKWAGTPEITQAKQHLSTDLSSSPKQLEAQKNSSHIVEREKSARIRKSGAEKKDQRLKVSTKDEISEASEEAYSDLTEREEQLVDPPLPHEMPLQDSRISALQELEKEAALEELAQSLRTTGLSEEEIEEHLQALATPSEPEQFESEEPPQGDRSPEELEEELATSLFEAGVPDEDIENMIQGLFHQAEQPPPPFSAPEEDQLPTGQ